MFDAQWKYKSKPEKRKRTVGRKQPGEDSKS